MKPLSNREPWVVIIHVLWRVVGLGTGNDGRADDMASSG